MWKEIGKYFQVLQATTLTILSKLQFHNNHSCIIFLIIPLSQTLLILSYRL